MWFLCLGEQSRPSAFFVCFCYGSFSLRLVLGYILVAVLQHSQPVMTSNPLSNQWRQLRTNTSLFSVYHQVFGGNELKTCLCYPMCFSCSWHYQVLFEQWNLSSCQAEQKCFRFWSIRLKKATEVNSLLCWLLQTVACKQINAVC